MDISIETLMAVLESHKNETLTSALITKIKDEAVDIEFSKFESFLKQRGY